MVEAASEFRRSVTDRAFWKRIFTHGEAPRIIILVALIGAMAGFSDGLTFSVRNGWNILATASIMGVATIGQYFAMRVGGIDLSIRDLSLFSMGVSGVLMSGTLSTAAVATSDVIPVPLGVLLIFGITIGWSVAGGNDVGTGRDTTLNSRACLVAGSGGGKRRLYWRTDRARFA